MRTVVMLAFTSLLSMARPASAAAPDPTKDGPYPVGVTTTVFVDASRTDHLTQKPRTLLTEIWYPATDRARTMPRSTFSAFVPGGVTPDKDAMLRKVWRKSAAELDQIYTMRSVRDAPVRRGRFPVIIFSHGNAGSRHQNTFWCDFLASHGYVVASADHTGNAGITFLPDGPVPMSGAERVNSALDRPKDMSFLLDRMEEWNKGGDRRFEGRLDLSRPCAAGMSFGSMTAVRVADVDSRFVCVIAMSGAYPAHTNLRVPTLWMIGAEDQTIGPLGNAIVRKLHQQHEGPSYLLELKDGGHYSFTDIGKIEPNFGDGVGNGKRREGGAEFEYLDLATTYRIVNAYSAAFLGVHVRRDRSYNRFLERNGWPKELVWEARNAGQ